MIDALPPSPHMVSVSYLDFSRDTRTAEFQKDIVMQVLREQFKGTEVFVDASESRDGIRRDDTTVVSGEKDKGALSVSCRKCGGAGDTSLYISDSFRGSRSGSGIEGEFEVGNPGAKNAVWKVSIRFETRRYFIGSLAPGVQTGAVVSPSELAVDVCQQKSACTESNSFDTIEAANSRVREWSEMQARRTFVGGKPLVAADFTPPILVRTNDLVKIEYASESGLKILTSGRSLGAGSKGQVVKIEIGSRHVTGSASQEIRIIEGTVSSAGEVKYGR